MAYDLILFIGRINLALAAAVLLVLVVRKPVRTFCGARSAYALWLIAPLSMLALLLPARTVHLAAPARIVSIANDAVSSFGSTKTPADLGPDQPTLSNLPFSELLLGIWIFIGLARLYVQAERQRRFVQSLGNLSIGDGVLWSDRPGVGPAVVGAFHPRIVVPVDFAERFTREEQALILAHERTHLSVGDARINALVAVILCVFWFNPLAFLGAAALRIDQEIACDAAVLARHPRTRRAYGEAMLKTQLAPVIPPLGCHWPASANHQLKERFTLLATHRNSYRRNLTGGVAVAALSVSASVSAWAAQPAQIVRDVAAQVAPHASQNPLFEAVRAGNVSTVRELIAGGANVDVSLPGDGSPLIEAARNGRFDIAELLLTAGANPNLAVSGDGAPLLQAASSGGIRTVRLLIDRGADVEQFVPGDETPLIKAAQAGDLDVVTYLVGHGANVTRAVPTEAGRMRSPLGEARRNGHEAVARYLASQGA
jgi:beta-lactamase regulating signal transducer with metallopeptidase domain